MRILKKLVAVVAAVSIVASGVPANAATIKGLSDLSLSGNIKNYPLVTKDSTANSIGKWNEDENDILNGLAVSVDGKWQYMAREWIINSALNDKNYQYYRDKILGGMFISENMFNSRYHVLNGTGTDTVEDFSIIPEKVLNKYKSELANATTGSSVHAKINQESTAQHVKEMNSTLSDADSVIRLDEETVPYISSSALRSVMSVEGKDARYTVDVEVYNLGSLESKSTAYVGAKSLPVADVKSPAGAAAGVISSKADCTLSVIAGNGQGSGKTTEWDCPSARVSINQAKMLSLSFPGGECNTSEVYVYKVGNEWKLDGDLPVVTPSNEKNQFYGWYTDKDFTKKFTGTLTDLDATKLYARIDVKGLDVKTSTRSAISAVKVGKVIKTGGVKYKIKTVSKVSKTGSATVIGVTSKKAKKLSIAGKIVTKGYTIRVTKIENNAFAKMKKLKSVTIGSEITSIGSKAFFKDAKLKKVVIKTKMLKTVKSKAFRGVHKKCKFVVPSGYATKYTKFFRK